MRGGGAGHCVSSGKRRRWSFFLSKKVREPSTTGRGGEIVISSLRKATAFMFFLSLSLDGAFDGVLLLFYFGLAFAFLLLHVLSFISLFSSTLSTFSPKSTLSLDSTVGFPPSLSLSSLPLLSLSSPSNERCGSRDRGPRSRRRGARRRRRRRRRGTAP